MFVISFFFKLRKRYNKHLHVILHTRHYNNGVKMALAVCILQTIYRSHLNIWLGINMEVLKSTISFYNTSMVWELSADELKWIIWGCGLTVYLWGSHFTQQPRCQTPRNVFLFGYHTSIIDSRVKDLTFCKNCLPYLKYFVWLFADNLCITGFETTLKHHL